MPTPHALQCVNELNQWLSALRKVSIHNTGLLGSYHPGIFRGDKWSCCHQRDKTGGMEAQVPGCHIHPRQASGPWLHGGPWSPASPTWLGVPFGH